MNVFAGNREQDLSIIELDSLSFQNSESIKDVSNLAIKIEGYVRPIFIGAWCYRKKERYMSRNNSNLVTSSYQNIDQSTLTLGRMDLVGRILLWLVSLKEMRASPKTIKTNFGQFVFFLIWCDEQEDDLLTSDDDVVCAYEGYTDHLIHRYSSNQLNINSASTYQGVVRDALCLILGEQDIAKIHSVRKIFRSSRHAISAKSPSTIRVIQNMELLYSVFDSLSVFLLKFQPFPLKLKLEHGTFCMFPIKDAISVTSSSGVGFNKSKEYKTCIGFNFSDFRLSSYDEVHAVMTKQWNKKVSSYFVNLVLHKAADKLQKANSQRDDQSRLRLCNMAFSCFIMIFISATGMNLSQVCDLRMSNITYPSEETISFDGVKRRARNKEVDYSIRRKMSRFFQKYLEFRRSVIDTFRIESCENIFFQAGHGKYRKITMSFSVRLAQDLSAWYNFNDLINAKEWRVFKGRKIINDHGPIKAAAMLQNKLPTTLKHYSEAPTETAKTSLKKFFDSYTDLFIASDEDELAGISVGSCLSIGDPDRLEKSSVVTPNCKNHEGCLFCTNYRVHADTKDVSKLLSFQYLLSETRHLQTNDRELLDRHEYMNDRIEYILERITKTGRVTEHDLKRIRQQIKSGELSPYWRRKMELLIDLEVI